jgi:hypothetical protein
MFYSWRLKSSAHLSTIDLKTADENCIVADPEIVSTISYIANI